MRVRQVLSLYGSTNSTTGVVTLVGQPAVQGATMIAVPQGMKFKLYRVDIDVQASQTATFVVQYNPNPSSSSSSWVPLAQFTVTAAGHYSFEYRARPIVVYGMLGTEAVQVSYTQTAVGGSAVAIVAELTDEEDEES